MTQTLQGTDAKPSGGGANLIVMGGIAVVLIGLYFLAEFSRSVSLNRSATGFDGLPMWLAENETPARTFYGRAVLDSETVALRVYPLFDVDLGRPMSETNDETRAMGETDRDVRRYVVSRKLDRLPTLLVMPKWRAGVRSAGALHPKLLIADESADTLTGQIDRELGKLVRDMEQVTSSGPLPSGGEYVLHYPQTLTDSSCTPLIGSADAIILGRCEFDGPVYWVLADPDLLNNHGLSQGDNAEAAAALLPTLGGDTGQIVLDLSSDVWTRRRGADDAAQRSWSDLSRFFEYPFSVIWWSFALLGALTFWRAWRRFGAADARADEESGPRASRLVSMDTKARLLRLTGRDDALVRTHIDGRLETLADEILGTQRLRGDAGQERLRAAISRRSADLATDFSDFCTVPVEPATPPDTLLRHVARLDELIERILHEFGRTGRAG